MMYPSPHVFVIPKGVPDKVYEEIERSFHLFWFRYAVCASRIRTSLERLMDHFCVAKTRIAKDPRNPTAPGWRVPLDLSARIDKLPKKIGTQDYSETLHALRTIGNLGTHGSNLNRNSVLDAYTLLERALVDLFQDKSEKAEAIIKRLKSKKA